MNPCTRSCRYPGSANHQTGTRGCRAVRTTHLPLSSAPSRRAKIKVVAVAGEGQARGRRVGLLSVRTNVAPSTLWASGRTRARQSRPRPRWALRYRTLSSRKLRGVGCHTGAVLAIGLRARGIAGARRERLAARGLIGGRVAGGFCAQGGVVVGEHLPRIAAEESGAFVVHGSRGVALQLLRLFAFLRCFAANLEPGS